MKLVLISVLFLWATNISFSQSLPNFDEIKLKSDADFNKVANDAALMASNYLLSTPMDLDNFDRVRSLKYIADWMTGTPDYTFEIDEQVAKFVNKNQDLFGLYMTAMTKYVLENKSASNNQNEIKLNAVRIMLKYSSDPKNNVKITKEMKNAIKAEKKGKLEEFLNK